MKRRQIILGSIAAIFLLCIGFFNVKPGKANETKTFHLYAADMQQEMSKGVTLYSWGFGLWDPEKNTPASPPSIPGPELRVKEGDHVKVIFHNQQKEMHTIHFHGIDNSFAGDGTPDMSQHPTMNHETFTYEFDAKQAGTYWYHCHVEPDRHPEMGLYGAIIVEPKTAKYKVDKEFTLLLAERDPLLSLAEGTEAHQFVGTAAEKLQLDGEYDSINRKAQYYTINGKIDPEIPPLQVKEGGTYLIRLINAGSEVHTFHTHGHHFQVVASDGRDIASPQSKDSITIGPGERYDLLLKADNPGMWPVHCHMGPHHTHGMHMMMVYEGYGNKTEHQHAHSAAAASPMDEVKHHLALMKQYQFEKNYSQMKAEADLLQQSIQGFYNMLSLTNIDKWNDLEGSVSDIQKQLSSQIDAEALKHSIDTFIEKINALEQMMQGVMS